MSTPTNLFNELANLTQLYLLQEYKLSEWIYSESETYTFFKQLAEAQKKPAADLKPPAPAPSVVDKIEQNVLKSTPLKEEPPLEKKASKTLVDEKQPSLFIKLEEMEPPKNVDFSDLKEILKERFPKLQLVEQVPNGIKNQKSAHGIVLHTTSNPLDKVFLTNLTKAIDICLAPASLLNSAKIEFNNEWEAFLSQPHLKRILIAQKEFDLLPNLSKHYTPTPFPCLGKVPVLFLPELSLFYKEPNRKQSLWTSVESFFAADPHEKLS